MPNLNPEIAADAHALLGSLYQEFGDPFASPRITAETGDVVSPRVTRRFIGVGLIAAAATAGIGMSLETGRSAHDRVVAAATATTLPDRDVLPELTDFNPELAAHITIQEVGVVGEAPCGPEIDTAEALRRFNSGESVVKPGETARYLNENPRMERGFNDFYERVSNNDTRWIDWIAANVHVENPEILEGHQDQGIRALKARETMAVLNQDINVQNHQCDPETGAIKEVNNITRLQRGEQVWAINVSSDVLKEMAKQGVALPDGLIVLGDIENAAAVALVMERLACNNPLLERELEKALATTTTSPTTPETTTPTTTPSTTTSTTTPSTTSTSTTSTTTPSTTTSTTTPSTTSTSTTSTTTPSTTTSTTTPSTTSTSTTSTTAPPKVLYCVGPEGPVRVFDENGDGDLTQADIDLTEECNQLPNNGPGTPNPEGPVGTTSTTAAPNTTTTRPGTGNTTPTTGVMPTSTLPPQPIPTSVSTTAPAGPGPNPSVTFIP
jgi:hypothetical protein